MFEKQYKNIDNGIIFVSLLSRIFRIDLQLFL